MAVACKTRASVMRIQKCQTEEAGQKGHTESEYTRRGFKGRCRRCYLPQSHTPSGLVRIIQATCHQLPLDLKHHPSTHQDFSHLDDTSIIEATLQLGRRCLCFWSPTARLIPLHCTAYQENEYQVETIREKDCTWKAFHKQLPLRITTLCAIVTKGSEDSTSCVFCDFGKFTSLTTSII
jgi:hypothetical protein